MNVLDNKYKYNRIEKKKANSGYYSLKMDMKENDLFDFPIVIIISTGHFPYCSIPNMGKKDPVFEADSGQRV